MTRIKQAVMKFVLSGGRVSRCGKFVFGVRGHELSQTAKVRNDRSYYTVSVSHDGQSLPVPVHRIVAFLKYGVASLAAPTIRHLNDDPSDNAWDNIAIGTRSDNALDRPAADRILHAQKAGKAGSRHSDETWSAVRGDHAAGMGYKKLRKKYGIGLSTLSFQLSKTAARQSLPPPLS